MNRPAAKIRVLVTGATGFVGRNVLAALTARSDVATIAACRTPSKLPSPFTGEVRAGDLRDAGYRHAVVEGVDVVCHTGTWASFWGHEAHERTNFFEPARDLIEEAIRAGVGRLPRKDWRIATGEALTQLKASGYPWPRLVQGA
jgi:uncharacterized protein YbjT (DUF2867 family)